MIQRCHNCLLGIFCTLCYSVMVMILIKTMPHDIYKYVVLYSLFVYREDQSVWERRAPLGPQHVRKLVKQGVKVCTKVVFVLNKYINLSILS
jgi:hypothetical protein